MGWVKPGRGWEQLEPGGDLGMDRHSCPTASVTCTASLLHTTRLLFFLIFTPPPPLFFFPVFIVCDSPLGCDIEKQE